MKKLTFYEFQQLEDNVKLEAKRYRFQVKNTERLSISADAGDRLTTANVNLRAKSKLDVM